MWGKALADIWCNNGGVPSRSFQQNCIIAAVRDNGDFFDVLGIVGRGPLGAYAIGGNASGSFVTNSDGFTFLLAPLADGWPAHGLKIGSNGVSTSTNSALGLRQVPGWGFILGSGDQRYNQFGLYNIVGNVPVDKTYTPDTAFCELLYQKPSGMNPSSADTHTMVVPIAQGLTGFLWDASDVRSSFGGLTNPFWIAINTYLRGMGLETADAATQLDTFVRPSVFAGDGTGCAEIADDLAAAILGAGMETQFSFQGTVDTQKPLRDWLREILNTGLGYYTWEFGKLKLGTRINASAVDSYTAGSMKFQSLRLTPIEAAFEKMILDFADVQYQWQANTAEYSDKDHAAYYGRSGAPLTARMHSLGAPTLSQNLRLAAVRTREEIGGVNATEWKNARNAYWETTLLGLSNEVGQVVSITDAKIPGGTGKFRINRWELRKDYSIALYGKTVTDSMYDLTVGPKPVDVTPQPLPVLVYPIPSGPAWAPCQVQAPSWDALFPGEWNFDSNQTYTTLADGSVNANLVITGKLPVNQYAPGVSAPSIGTISQTTTGGSLPASTMLRVALCVLDSSGRPSPSSAIALINTSASGTDTFTLSNISWPAVSGLASWVLFVSAHDDTICAQASGSLTATGGGTTYTPTSITFAGPVTWSTWALPSPYTKRLRIKAKLGGHLGIMGVLVDSVTSTTVTCAGLIDTSGAPPNLVGRVLSVIGRNGANTPYLSVSITAYNPTTGTLTVSPHATVSGQPSQSIAAGDIVIVRMKPDAPNTSNPTQVTDSGWLNSQTGDFSGGSWPGLNPGTEVGDILRVIQGTGRGQLRKLTGNTTTGFSWDLPLLLDTTSVFIIEKPTWDYVSDSTDISNADYSHGTTLTVAATNFINRSIVVAGFTVDSSGNESPDGDGPIREDWIFGSQGASNVAGFTLQADGTLGVQSDAAPAFYLNDPFVPGAVKAYLKSAPTGADFTFTLNAGATTWMTLTIPAGSTSVTATSAQLTAAGTIPANTNVRLDITAVGTTFPGSDLSIFIYS
jgi:hypothetical protein